jgi:hypothetical protein
MNRILFFLLTDDQVDQVSSIKCYSGSGTTQPSSLTNCSAQEKACRKITIIKVNQKTENGIQEVKRNFIEMSRRALKTDDETTIVPDEWSNSDYSTTKESQTTDVNEQTTQSTTKVYEMAQTTDVNEQTTQSITNVDELTATTRTTTIGTTTITTGKDDESTEGITTTTTQAPTTTTTTSAITETTSVNIGVTYYYIFDCASDVCETETAVENNSNVTIECCAEDGCNGIEPLSTTLTTNNITKPNTETTTTVQTLPTIEISTSSKPTEGPNTIQCYVGNGTSLPSSVTTCTIYQKACRVSHCFFHA